MGVRAIMPFSRLKPSFGRASAFPIDAVEPQPKHGRGLAVLRLIQYYE
jgi:hypothetical protein